MHAGSSRIRPGLVMMALIGAAVVLGACSDDIQERYDKATKELEDARESRNKAKENLQAKQQELQALQEKLDEAEDRLEEARAELEEAESYVNENVTDAVLFRAIQRKLLDEDRFDDAAISVGVSDRVVTLTGSVPDSKTHKAALKIASTQSGVKEVVDFLEIVGAEGKQEKAKAKPAAE